MQVPFKGLWEDLFRTPAPIVITFLMGVYLAGLAYYNNFIYQPELKFNFYSISPVKVHIENANENYAVQGIFNNVIEGDRKVIDSKIDSIGDYVLNFQVNSPRPAILYIEGESIEMFLVPDSTLRVNVVFDANGLIDSVGFKGITAPICRYYRRKNQVFENSKLRVSRNVVKSEDLISYGKVLDSLTGTESRFLDTQKVYFQLPAWFVDFENNEMMYQKAYLKLSNLSKESPPENYLDKVSLDNPNAVFSYYYYLYLNTYFKKQALGVSKTQSDSTTNKNNWMDIVIADTTLKSEAHDIYITRSIFRCLQKNEQNLGKELFDKHKNFKERKYYRFLKSQFSKEQ